MITNPILSRDIFEFLLSKGLIAIDPKGSLPIRGSGTKTPIQIVPFGWVQPDKLQSIAKFIIGRINACNEARQGLGKPAISAITGSKFSEILAYKVAEATGMQFLPKNRYGEIWPRDMGNAEVAYVSDIVATGKTMGEAVSHIRNAGANCEEAFTIFDYGFNLTRAQRDLNIHSLVTLRDVAHFPITEVSDWAGKQHPNLFREGMNPSIVAMAS